jgi:glycosyltransferase involved in cell wall biosynthesis
VPLTKMSCVPSAVDIDKYQQARDRQWFEQEFGLASNDFVIGVVAQLIPRKGHRYLFDVLPELLQSHPNIKVVMFGQGPLQQEICQRIESSGLRFKVKLVGFREDIPRIMPNLDLLVHPAEKEGLGVSLLQAAAAGVPLVASAAGGIPEIVRHGMTGLLFPIKDTKSLANSIDFMIRQPEQRQQMADSAKELVKVAFSIPAMVKGNLAIYERLLENRA